LFYDLPITGVHTALCVVASKDPGRDSNEPPWRHWLSDCRSPLALPVLMQSHRSRHASAAAGSQCRNFFSRVLLHITMQSE